MTLYLLLIIPHLVALGALLGYALSSDPGEAPDECGGESYGFEGGSKLPPKPSPLGPALDGPPLPNAAAPARRLRNAERLSDLHPRRQRRDRPSHPPNPAPKTTSNAGNATTHE